MYNDWLRRPTLWFEHIVFMFTLQIGEIHQFLACGFLNIFYVHPYLGKISILTNMFQMGWFNHQLDFNAYFETNSLAQAPTGEVLKFRNQIQPVLRVCQVAGMVVHFELGMTEDESPKLSGRCVIFCGLFPWRLLLFIVCVCLIDPTQKLEFGDFCSQRPLLNSYCPGSNSLATQFFQ